MDRVRIQEAQTIAHLATTEKTHGLQAVVEDANT